MTQNELELLNLVRASDDPEQALLVVAEIICRYIELPLSCSEPTVACLLEPA